MKRSGMKKVLFGLALMTAGCLGASPAAAALPSNFTVFEVPWAPAVGSGGSGTRAFGMNNLGEITGNYYDANGFRGFVRSAGGTTYTAVDVPGARETWAEGINNVNWVVGGYNYDAIPGDPNSGKWSGFLYDRSKGTYDKYDAVDPAGQTVNYTYLDYVSDKLDAVTGKPLEFTGHYGLPGGLWQGFYVKDGVTTIPFSIPATDGSGGHFETQLDYKVGAVMAGHYYDYVDGKTYGFLSNDEGATFERIFVGGYDETELERLSTPSIGVMVGYLTPEGGGNLQAWYRDALGDDYLLFDPLPAGIGDTFAESINDSGLITGYFGQTMPDGSHRMYSYIYDPNAAAVPEPSTFLLTGAGIAALGFLGRRRSRSAK